MSKNGYCIFDYNKLCNNCGECDRCDIDPSKKCNNCGKCLEEGGYDMKAIKIDEVVMGDEKLDTDESSKNSVKMVNTAIKSTNTGLNCQDKKTCTDKEIENDNTKDEEIHTDVDSSNNWKPNIEYIDDVEGLNDLLKDIKKLDEVAFEEFPGLIRFKNERYKN
ncbi:hypothetical protein [Clostridium sp. JN-1]|uniref:hypothetical protein n=1 Tax=Clostridium sp. JN-1 TaxID=2483110 RepID=UPI000F0B5818|nr:hypothetical protein [Clostridium sp. JN-1]